MPGTAAGVEAFRELTAEGISVNVTLLFAVERYEEIAEAYVAGLERRAAAGKPIDALASVASFFVSRVDGKVDAALEKAGRSDLQGKAAIANARVAYESFQRIFSGPRWEALAAQGRQRPAAALGVDVDQEPRLPGHALRRRADRARHGQHDARRDDRGGARPRHGRAHDRPRRRRRPPAARPGARRRRRHRPHLRASSWSRRASRRSRRRSTT